MEIKLPDWRSHVIWSLEYSERGRLLHFNRSSPRRLLHFNRNNIHWRCRQAIYEWRSW